MKQEGEYCRVCERNFYGNEYQVTNGVCEFCQTEINRGKPEAVVASEQRRRINKVLKGFKSIRAYNKEFN